MKPKTEHTLLLTGAIFAILLFFNIKKSDAQQFTEYEIKAGYLINFTKFVKWPASTDTKNLVIGIYGPDPFEGILTPILQAQRKKSNNWLVEHYQSTASIKPCHILFVSQANAEQLDSILNFTNQKPILTIGDNLENFCQNGGIINFASPGSSKRFQINNQEAKKSGLIIDYRLLELSEIIESANKVDEEVKGY